MDSKNPDEPLLPLQSPNELKPRTDEKIIQPINLSSADINQAHSPVSPQIAAETIYPSPTVDINVSVPSVNAAQSFALKSVEIQAETANKLVCMRVKSVLVISILIVLASLYAIFIGLKLSNGIITVIGAVQLLAGMGLLFTKDPHTATLILKVFLVLQILNEFMSLANPSRLILSSLQLLLIAVAYFSVKSLRY